MRQVALVTRRRLSLPIRRSSQAVSRSEDCPMTIKVGDPLPDVTFTVMTPEGPQARTTADIFKGRKVVLFGVPGAFTPTCSMNHLPGFLTKEMEIKAKGVEEIAVTSVNDVFVMDAWAKQSGGIDKI